MNGIYILATAAGLKSRQLTKSEVKLLGELAERILDYVDWFKDVFSEEARAHAEMSFSDGIREAEAGELVTLS